MESCCLHETLSARVNNEPSSEGRSAHTGPDHRLSQDEQVSDPEAASLPCQQARWGALLGILAAQVDLCNFNDVRIASLSTGFANDLTSVFKSILFFRLSNCFSELQIGCMVSVFRSDRGRTRRDERGAEGGGRGMGPSRERRIRGG